MSDSAVVTSEGTIVRCVSALALASVIPTKYFRVYRLYDHLRISEIDLLCSLQAADA